jgi:hypothetical protein
MHPAKLVVAVAAAILFAQTQCVAACAAQLCPADSATQPTPPCHPHHDRSHDQTHSSCSFQLIVPQASLPHALHLDAPVLSVLGPVPPIAVVIPADTHARVLSLSDSSPPGSNRFSIAILRI